MAKKTKGETMEMNLATLKQMVRQTNALVRMREALHDALPGGWDSYPDAREVDALLAEAGVFDDDAGLEPAPNKAARRAAKKGDK